MPFQKGDKPKIIAFSVAEIDFIRNLLKQEKCLLVTQKLWKIIQKKFNLVSRQAYSRRKTAAGLSFEDLAIGYTTDEFILELHPKKSLMQITCEHCNLCRVIETRQLLSRKHWYIECCYHCYHKLYQQDNEWREKQSKLQTESQHRPEVQEKHRINSKAMWERNRIKLISAFKLRMSKQENRNKISETMKIRWDDEDYRKRVTGKGILKHSGLFENQIVYDSKLELQFLLWSLDKNDKIIRPNFGISYHDETGKERKYYPDFLVNDQFLIEVKGQRWIDTHLFCYLAKCSAAEKYCSLHKLVYCVIKHNDIPKLYRKKALEYHETQKKNNNSISRQSS